MYCLYTIFQNLHFSKSHFSETPQEKYDLVIFLQPKVVKCAAKILKIGSLIKNYAKKLFELALCMCKGGNPSTLKLKTKQIFGIMLRVLRSAMLMIQFCFGLVHFR